MSIKSIYYIVTALVIGYSLTALALSPTCLDVKVLTIGMTKSEVKLWIERENMTQSIAVPGAIDPLHCNDKGHCAFMLGPGTANAAVSTMALGLNPAVNLKNAYILVQGIAGGNPALVTLGAAVWSEWAVDADTHHHIDARELPMGWDFTDFHLGCNTPWCKGWTTGTEVFHVNKDLTEKAYQLSRDVVLADAEEAQVYRLKYQENTIARNAPFVAKCDVISGGNYFHGKIMSRWAAQWMKQWTAGEGNYCVSAMEETGLMTAFKRLADANLINAQRIMILRTVANFDQQYEGIGALESLTNKKGALGISFENAYRVGRKVTEALLRE